MELAKGRGCGVQTAACAVRGCPVPQAPATQVGAWVGPAGQIPHLLRSVDMFKPHSQSTTYRTLPSDSVGMRAGSPADLSCAKILGRSWVSGTLSHASTAHTVLEPCLEPLPPTGTQAPEGCGFIMSLLSPLSRTMRASSGPASYPHSPPHLLAATSTAGWGSAFLL